MFLQEEQVYEGQEVLQVDATAFGHVRPFQIEVQTGPRVTSVAPSLSVVKSRKHDLWTPPRCRLESQRKLQESPTAMDVFTAYRDYTTKVLRLMIWHVWHLSRSDHPVPIAEGATRAGPSASHRVIALPGTRTPATMPQRGSAHAPPNSPHASRTTRSAAVRISQPMMDQPLQGQRILMFVGDIYEDLELWYPRLRLIEAGAEVIVAGPQAGREYTGKNGYPCQSDTAIGDVHLAEIASDRWSGLVVPGGFMPDKLRRDREVLDCVRAFDAAGKLIAAICHGGWIPISAGVYSGVRVTGSPGIRDDLVNAGAHFEDQAVVVDRHFVSSRNPQDLPDFCRGILCVLTSPAV